MSQFNKNRRQKGDTKKPPIDESKPILVAFQKYSTELDDKHDRHERIVKLGRDITIESKRIIFLLHTIDSKKGNSEEVLQEAHSRLMKLCQTHFHGIADELAGRDPYQFARAYSAGLQEFIEAFTFYEFSRGLPISDWENLQTFLTYCKESHCEIDSPKEESEVGEDVVEKCVEAEVVNESTTNLTDQLESMEIATDVKDSVPVNSKSEKRICFVQPNEYILGLADLTGEVMRRCVNSLGSGDIKTCFQTCSFLQELYTGYMGLRIFRLKDLNHKIFTLKQSVIKTENVCYNVKMRGGEAAKWGAVDSVAHDDDEGFYNADYS